MLFQSKLDSTEVLISKALFDSNIFHDELVFVNKMAKEHGDINEEIKNLKVQQLKKDFKIFIKQCYLIVWRLEKRQKVKSQRLKR